MRLILVSILILDEEASSLSWKRHGDNTVIFKRMEGLMADHQTHHDDLEHDGLIAGHFTIFLMNLGEIMLSVFRLAFRR